MTFVQEQIEELAPLPVPDYFELSGLTVAPLHPEQRAGEVYLGMQNSHFALVAGWMTCRLGSPCLDRGIGASVGPRVAYPAFVQASELVAYGISVGFDVAGLDVRQAA